MHSCIYEGRVAHGRYQPVVHKFWYRIYMAYLDLDELQDEPAVRRLITRGRFAPARFAASDHLTGWSGPVKKSIIELVERESGVRPSGPIRLLTQLRNFGYYFSPLNIYYCFDQTGQTVDCMVAEVTNTPWREQHLYVLSPSNQTSRGRVLQYEHDKQFHVSPFLDMDYRYRWRLQVPGEQLRVHIENRRDSTRVFDATMKLARRPLTRWSLTKMQARYPVMTARIMAAIHWQALKLWWKKCPVYSHPRKQPVPNDASKWPSRSRLRSTRPTNL